MKKAFLLFALLFQSILIFGQALDSANTCVKKALKYQKNNDFYKAITQCDKCIESKPDDASLYYLRGMCHFYLNHVYEMGTNFAKALKLDSSQFYEEDIDFLKYYSDELYRIKDNLDSLEFNRLLPELDYRKAYTRKDSLQGTLTPIRNCYDITYQSLTVQINADTKSIKGSNKITFRWLKGSDSLQVDLFRQYRILGILSGNDTLQYSRAFNAVFVQTPQNYQVGESYTLEVLYEGTPIEAPNPPWDGGFTWKEHNGKPYLGVSCEHLGGSSWFPTKDHLSEKPDSMDIHIQVPDGLEVVANGDLVKVVDMEGAYNDHHWHVSYPINNYNVTFYVVDKFIHWQEKVLNILGDSVAIDYYVLEENLDTAKVYYKKTKDILRFFEEAFGPYPFPKDGLAFVESPYSGMEHQGAIAIGGDYSAEEGSYEIVNGYDRLVVHELAHEWWGNSISAADLADVWLQEGFATYAEALFIEHMFGEQAYLDAVSDQMYYIVNAWPLVGKRGVNYNGFLGQDVYSKGATLLHNLRCFMGNDEVFFKMIKDFHQDFKQKPLRSEDFIKHAQGYVPSSLKPFFEVFLYQKKPPVLQYSFEHRGKNLTFWYQWTNVPSGFKMPINLSLNGWAERILVTDIRDYVSYGKVKWFDLPSTYYPPLAPAKNSFTYYQADWLR